MTTLNISGWDVLIVDDEPDNLTFLEVLLDFFDAKVTTANSGEQARDLLLGHAYQLALLDLQMPKVSGWDLVRQVRASQDTAIHAMPLIAVTALAMPGDKERVLASGFDGYITKPVEVTTFMQTVLAVLESIPARQPVSTVIDSAQLPSTPPEVPTSAALPAASIVPPVSPDEIPAAPNAEPVHEAIPTPLPQVMSESITDRAVGEAGINTEKQSHEGAVTL